MSPRRGNGNPYTDLLSTALIDLGKRVVEYAPLRHGLIDMASDVIHVHWPEQLLVGRNPWRTTLKQLRLFTDLDLARRRGTAVIWTAHNVKPHDEALRDRRHHEPFLRFLSRVDGVVHLSAEGERITEATYPSLAGKPKVRVPLGDLSVAYPTVDRETARRALRVDAEALVLLFGRLKQYRGVEDAVRMFLGRRPAGVRLLVTGACRDPDLAQRLTTLSARAEPSAITLELAMLSDVELAVRLAAADLVVQPFTDVLHSGTIHLALGAGVPVLAPRRGALPELQDHVGSAALHLYDGSISMRYVTAALAAPRRPVPVERLGDWAAIATGHDALYAAARR
jgi:glycosyltransferase involved in cell wall biosynthesis